MHKYNNYFWYIFVYNVVAWCFHQFDGNFNCCGPNHYPVWIIASPINKCFSYDSKTLREKERKRERERERDPHEKVII